MVLPFSYSGTSNLKFSGLVLKRLIIVVVTLTIVSLLNLNCGKSGQSKEDGKVTITFWHSFVSSTVLALDQLIDRFENEYPDIKIKAQYIPTGDALIQKLITAIQSRTAPDISWIHSDFLEDLVESDAIYKMNKFIKGENGLSESDLNDIYPSLMKYASWKDTLYSMPMEATNIALLYNRRMFVNAGLDPEIPPKDWNELHEFARRLTLDSDHDGKYDQIGIFIPIFPASGPLGGWMVWQWLPFLWQAGGYLIDEEQTRVQYNSDAGIEALAFWKKIYDDLNLRTFTTDYEIAFASGYLAMALDGPWNLPRYKNLLKDIDWALAPLPAGPEKRATIVGGEYLTIFKQSKHPDAAWTFIKWIIHPKTQATWAMKSGYLPMRRSVRDLPEFKEYLAANPNFRVFVDQMDHAYAQRSIDYYGMEITRHIAEAIEESVVGDVDPELTLNEAAGKSNTLLELVKR